VYLYKNGSKHEGDWKAGGKHGKGKYRFHDGEIFEGLRVEMKILNFVR